MRCLVTGATGVLGSRLARLLLERGASVAVLIRPTSDPWRISDLLPEVCVISGDLAHIRESEVQIREFRADLVFHLGWSGVASADRDAPDQITCNVNGSLELLQLAAAAGCRRWIGLGSQAEHGPHDGVLTEAVPVRPITTYGTAKLAVGLLSQRLCATYGIGFCWLRLLAVYGPMDDASHLIPQVTLKLLARSKPALSPGEQRWDYLYVDDAAEAIWQAGTNARAAGAFILGSGVASTVREVVETIRDLIDPMLPLGFGDLPYRSDQTMHLQADISALRLATGWSPSTPLVEGLNRTVAWFSENQGRRGGGQFW